MTGDFSRDTFRPEAGYTSVRLQQGRLLTDADWNEQADIARHALRETAADTIGQSGFPEDSAGFALIPAGAGNGLAITPGEAYVDGIRVAHAGPQLLSLKRRSGAGAATEWQLEAGVRVTAGDLLLLPAQPLDHSKSVQVSELLEDADGRQVFKCAAALSANQNVKALRFHAVDSQPYLPAPPPTLPTQDGTYLAYLDVWERPVGALEDPLIRETAFGGPDTAIRDQLVWQVRFASEADLAAAGALAPPMTCKSFGPGWTPLGTATPVGSMAARAEAGSAADNPCVLPSTGGYRSLENRLFRVQIHNGGRTADGGVTFKWSSDNGIHRFVYSAIDGVALLVDSVGRDEAGSLAPDDWIEISDEARSLSGRPGFFARISDVNGNRVSLGELLDPDSLAPLTVAGGAPDMAKLPTKAQLRRWEGGAPIKVNAGTWAKLRDGVEIRFAGGRYSTADHWTIPARTLTASIEWPRDPATGDPAFLPAMGVRHHYCALAIARRAAGNWTIADCRNLFAPLTRQFGFHYLGGDGQEALPNPLAPNALVPLEADLRVGYVRGRTPVAGARVRFTTATGSFGAGQQAIAETGPDGVAAVKWQVDSKTAVQQARAELIDAQGQRTHLPIHFTAFLSTAARTAFDPKNIPALAGETTVQGAIEKLAGMQQIGCSTRIVVEGSDWVSVLKSLQPGENASICFQRGTFETAETVLLSKLGHVTLSGAGAATRIVGRRRECALEFRECASVTVHDIDISTPDGTGAIENFARRRGSLTVAECGAVDISDATLSCGAGVAAERTCLTVAGKAGAPIPSVRIERNRFTAGYGQDGLLVTDCARAVIAGNELGVAPRPASLSVAKLLEGKEWRNRLIGMLVVNPVTEQAGRGVDKGIRGGDFIATFESTVAQAEWDALVAADPPKALDIRNQRTFAAYAERIIQQASTVSEKMPASHKRRIETLGRQPGGATRVIDDTVKRALLVGGDISVGRLDDKTGRRGAIILQTLGQRILFDSPVNQADWSTALKMMPAERITKGSDLIAHAESIAGRMIVDEKFRSRLASAQNWYLGYIKSLPTFGRQAITCAGIALGTVSVTGNRTDGYIQGVHIGTSGARQKASGQAPKQVAGIVSVEGNTLFLRLPGEDVYAPFGLFVGNADSARIEGNTLAWSAVRGSKKRLFAQGIRVWGYIGRFLIVAGNRISTSSLGIRVKPVETVKDQDWPKYLWLAADNLVDSAGQGLTLRVPPFMEKRNNRPA